MQSVEGDDELVRIFIEESREHLTAIEGDLLSIEQSGAAFDDGLVNRMFRGVHSMKGAAGFFGFDRIRELAHASENLLGQVRSAKVTASGDTVGALLASVDVLAKMLEDIPASASFAIGELVDRLNRAASGAPQHESSTPARVPNAAPRTPARAEARSERPPRAGRTCVDVPGRAVHFDVATDALERARLAGGDNVYVLEYDLVRDVDRRGKDAAAVLSEVSELTSFLAGKLDVDAMPSLEAFSKAAPVPYFALVCSHMDRMLMNALLDIDVSRIHPVPIAPTAEPRDAAPSPPASIARPAISPPVVEALPIDATPPRHEPAEIAGDGTKTAAGGKSDASVRVGLGILDKLMTLAGELVLTRNQLLQNVDGVGAKTLDATQKIDRITTELQDAIMSTRMQSIGLAFQKFRRIARDLAAQLGKSVELVLEGEDVELDRTIVEAIGDPLTHLVRNALDHGLETPSVRRAAGKRERGVLRMSAQHKAGHVIIEIKDDGRGIDPVKIKAKALDLGICGREQLATMSEQAVLRLIFRPGFSTADKVTDVSGRGVGMDVVNTNLTRLGGVVDLESEVGVGTTFRIRLPLTLAIIPCLLVSEEGEHYAIPQANLVELQRIAAREIGRRIERLGDVEVMRLRGKLLPVVRLRDVLGIETRTYVADDGTRRPDRRGPIGDRRGVDAATGAPARERRRDGGRRKSRSSALNLAIVAAGEQQLGLIVESMQDSAEIVVKPLGRHLGNCNAYAGATILGDGRTALILDVISIAHQVMADADLESRGSADDECNSAAADRQTLLIVENGRDTQFGIPLGFVDRIERIEEREILVTGGRRTMTCRGRSLELFALEEVARVAPRLKSGTPYVVVFRYGAREVGLVVADIVDIVETSGEIDDVTLAQPGIFGSLLIDGCVTLLVDLNGVADAIAAQSVRPIAASMHAPKKAEDVQRTILVVEDSKFFLSKITSFVEAAGHLALTAGDGLEALAVLEQTRGAVDLILTDIEMPHLDGFALARRVRADTRFAQIPIVAVTSVMGSEAERTGKEVGIDEYLVKLDREKILGALERFLPSANAAYGRPADRRGAAASDARAARTATSEGASGSFQFVVFAVGDHLCGVDVGSVQEINKNVELTTVHRSRDFVSGVINLRGDIVTIIDARRRFGLDARPIDRSMRIIVVRWEGESVGLLVDDVDDIIVAEKKAVLETPRHVGADLAAFFAGVYQKEEDLVGILDVHRFLAVAQ